MTADEFINLLQPLSKRGKGFKAHRYLALLAVVQLVREGRICSCAIEFSEDFRNRFRELIATYGGPTDRNRPHTPFFHLSSFDFWELVPRVGKEEALARATTVGSAGELTEIVDHAELAPWLFNILTNKSESEAIEKVIVAQVTAGMESRNPSGQEPIADGSPSLFVHEQNAVEALRGAVLAHGLGPVLQNLELHDPQSNRYFETDVIVVCLFGIYVVELKHWSGRIEIRPNSWLQNNSWYKPDPHKANNFKAKLVRGLYERKFPAFPSLYVESVVVFTNPDVSVDGASVPQTERANPTFDSIDRFIDYLKHQRSSKSSKLKDEQAKAFADYLSSLHQAARPRDFVFPDYEVVERLYHHEDRAEVIARPTNVRHRRLSRLRIFFPPPSGGAETMARFRERATATLNAVAKVGEHPNILRVWSVPNENGYIVEGSDWSELGTLRDVLARESPLPPTRSLQIIKGILSGLTAIHRESVIHRFLAPENVLMVGDTPKLMNFDLSYQLEDNRITVIPDAAGLKRTPYIAPEVYRSGTLTEAADLFSVGALFFELLTGGKPFSCSTDLERTDGKLSDDATGRLKRCDAPDEWKRVIDQLLRLDVANRPNCADAVLTELEVSTAVRSVAARPVNQDLPPGASHDVFEIEALARRGAASQIYRARGPQGSRFALKLFNSDVPLPRIISEQDTAAAVHHPSIVSTDRAHRWEDGRFYLPMAWLEGASLRERINSGRIPSLSEFREVSVSLLDAVARLHDCMENGAPASLLHNDIKPENVILRDDGIPVLIDFGSASVPRVGLYEGSEGYVAPDLRLGEDRSYCEDGDIFALGVTLFEWFSGHHPYENLAVGAQPIAVSDLRDDVSKRLEFWFQKAVASSSRYRFASASQIAKALDEAFLAMAEEQEPEICVDEAKSLEEATIPPLMPPVEEVTEPIEGGEGNPFVPYLNSLHSLRAGNENAIAEAQARHKLFPLIHVPHPLADTIYDLLTTDTPRHVILTGHAGDGKSTIGLELFQRLSGLPPDQPLKRDLDRREDLLHGERKLVLIKDMSEWSGAERTKLISEMLEEKGPVFFIISNTGTLLDMFMDYERESAGDWVKAESDVLATISVDGPEEFAFRGTPFSIINLSMVDNLQLAEKIFARMLDADRWAACKDKDCREHCPIYRNVSTMQTNVETVRERLFLLYRRMYEYGSRFTLRQLTAHLAYLITSGLNREDIRKMSQRAVPPLMTEFMFFNRFFGDNGFQRDQDAEQLRVIRELQHHKMGFRPSPTWERKLWLRGQQQVFKLDGQGCESEFGVLREVGAGLRRIDGIEADRARLQVRRMVYFLHGFSAKEDSNFLRCFVNSPMLLEFMRWQRAKRCELSLPETTTLRQKIMHVLQEHFTGVRLPEGTPTDRHLFITLSRRNQEVRQSAQVVLARFPEDDLLLELISERDCAGGERRTLVLQGRPGRTEVFLRLDLPFLDYVMMRNQGEVGEELQPSFVDRLERLRGRLIRSAAGDRGDDIMLVRLRTNHTFRRQIFAVREDRMEVTDG